MVAVLALEVLLAAVQDKTLPVRQPILAVEVAAVLKVMALMPQARAAPVSSSLDAINKVRHER